MKNKYNKPKKIKRSKPIYNLVGKRFGPYVILERDLDSKYKSTREVIWKCKCDCGVVRSLKGNYIRNKLKYDTCCCSLKHSKSDIGEVGLNLLYYTYNRGALQRDLTFKLSLEEFKFLTSSRCYYCNELPKQISKLTSIYKEREEYSKYIYNGIDRKDNNIGYEYFNCLPCCRICNFMKSNFGYEQFLNKIKQIQINLEL